MYWCNKQTIALCCKLVSALIYFSRCWTDKHFFSVFKYMHLVNFCICLIFFDLQAPVNFVCLHAVKPRLRPLAMAVSTVSIHIFGDVPSSPLVGLLQVLLRCYCWWCILVSKLTIRNLPFSFYMIKYRSIMNMRLACVVQLLVEILVLSDSVRNMIGFMVSPEHTSNLHGCSSLICFCFVFSLKDTFEPYAGQNQ